MHGVVLINKEEPWPSQLFVILVAYRLLTFLAETTCTATHVHTSFFHVSPGPGTVAMATSDPGQKVWVFTFEP